MTKRITLVFDLPDDDVKQVEDMLSDILATFDGEVFLFKVREPAKDIDNLLGDIITVLPEEVFLSFHDRVNCDLVPNWNKNTPTKNLRTLLDINIMVDFIADNVLNNMLRR